MKKKKKYQTVGTVQKLKWINRRRGIKRSLKFEYLAIKR